MFPAFVGAGKGLVMEVVRLEDDINPSAGLVLFQADFLAGL